ncbi:hypothetical protein [Mariniflexile sp.]|uniref:hypothetical protein n=1 Tax=Mariniflexile sp. TaxID=1979402 RepID=UPI003564DDC8
MKNKLTLTFYSFLLSLCVSLFITIEGNAQENGIYEINNNATLLKDTAKKTKVNDRENFYDLAFKIHPTSYANDKIIKKNNNNKSSKLTFNDSKSLGLLNQNNTDFNHIELVTIKLNSIQELNKKVDLTNANSFSNLKYVYIVCSFQCTESQIKEFIRSNSNIRIFYKIEIPS